MRRLLISIGAFLGLLSVSFIAFHNACEHRPGLSDQEAGTASLREPNSNNSATTASQALAQESNAVAVSSGNRDEKKKTTVSRRKGEDERKQTAVSREEVARRELAAETHKLKSTSRPEMARAVETQTASEPPASAAEEKDKRESVSPKIILMSGGVLEGSATKRVEPSYPPLAKAASVSGSVVVEVTVDESGSVISARVISGHPLLRDAAVTAARGWRFSPTQVSGAPVKAIGTITFNFNL